MTQARDDRLGYTGAIVMRGEIDVRVIIALICLSAALPAFAGGGTVHAPPEARLIAALDNMYRGAFDAADAELDALIEHQPNFRLAHYLQEILLPQRTNRPLETALDLDAEDGGRRALIDEALLRWSHHLSAPPPGAVPNAVLRLAPRYRHVVVVDLRRHRLYLWRNEGSRLTLVADFYASIGRGGIGKKEEGDLRTPVGVYHVTEYKPDDELPELYGDGAFPVNYPNSLDRRHGRTGHGIWVHGVPRDTYSREPRASEGCVVIANDDLQLLRRHLRPGLTPVVFTDELAWLTAGEAETRRRELMAEVRARAGEGRSDADPGDASIFRYPGEADTVLVSFPATPGDGTARRQQFWRRDPAAGWRIAHETRIE